MNSNWRAPSSPNDPFAGVLLVLIRGLLLWVLIPLGTIAWLFSLPWSRCDPGNFLGWLDNNQIAVLQRYVLRIGFPRPGYAWVHFRDVRTVTHRIRFGDWA